MLSNKVVKMEADKAAKAKTSVNVKPDDLGPESFVGPEQKKGSHDGSGLGSGPVIVDQVIDLDNKVEEDGAMQGTGNEEILNPGPVGTDSSNKLGGKSKKGTGSQARRLGKAQGGLDDEARGRQQYGNVKPTAPIPNYNWPAKGREHRREGEENAGIDGTKGKVSTKPGQVKPPRKQLGDRETER